MSSCLLGTSTGNEDNSFTDYDLANADNYSIPSCEIARIAVNLLLAEDHAVGYDSSPLRTCFDKFHLLH